VALRHQLWLDMPLSAQLWRVGKASQFWDVPIDVGFGSAAVVRQFITRPAGFGCGFNRSMQHIR